MGPIIFVVQVDLGVERHEEGDDRESKEAWTPLCEAGPCLWPMDRLLLVGIITTGGLGGPSQAGYLLSPLFKPFFLHYLN